MVNAPALTPIDDLVAAFWSWMKDMHVAKVSISCNDGSLSCSSFGPDVIAAIVDERTALKAENERLMKAYHELAVVANKVGRKVAAERALAERAGGVRPLPERAPYEVLQVLGREYETTGDMWAALRDALTTEPATPEGRQEAVTEPRRFNLGDRVTKTRGSSWTGRVVGFYSTALTPVGYAVESATETGSVQIYPEAALHFADISAGFDPSTFEQEGG